MNSTELNYFFENLNFKLLNHKPTSFKSEDKVYIHKQSSLDRNRVDIFFKSNPNIKRVWDIKSSDYVVVDKVRIFQKILKMKNNYYVKRNGVLNIEYLTQTELEVLNLCKLYTINECKLVFDNDFLKFINKEEGIELDNFDTLHDLFMSKDIKNINIAFEVISGVDFSKYELDILFLINRFKKYFERDSGLALGSNKNWKVLKSYFTSKGWVWDIYFYGVVKNVINKSNYTMEDLKPYIIKKLNWDLGDYVEDIKLK